MESYSVEAILSATDKGFSNGFKSALGTTEKFSQGVEKAGTSITKIAAGIGVFKAIGAATSMVSGYIGELSGDLENGAATWKTFNANMENIGKGKKEIAAVKNELTDFATKTIYSASDMATTYSQLAAVGIENTDKLVMGFGGLAAAAENPTQAMKTLSQQATQMAAKPMVQWQDFKLMLEQTPAGIAAVAKEMGMSTAEMVSSVQDGTIATQDFFDAVTKVGTNDTFTKMATEYKNLGQAMDGLKETVTNKLQPAYDKFSKIAIGGVEKLIDVIDKLDFSKTLDQFNSMDDILNAIKPTAMSLGSILAGAFAVESFKPFIDLMPKGLDSATKKSKAMFDSFKGFDETTGKAKRLSAKLIEIGESGKNMTQKVNLTNFAKGFENVKSKSTGFANELSKTLTTISPKFGNLAYNIESKTGGAFDVLDKKALGFLSTTTKVQDNFKTAMKNMSENAPLVGKTFKGVGDGVSKGLVKSFDTGTSVLSGFLNSVVKISSLAMKAVAPAAIVGLVLAGLGVALDKFGPEIDKFLTMAETKGPQVIQNFVKGITSKLPDLIASGTQMVTGLSQTIGTLLPVIVQAGVDIITSLVQGVGNNSTELIAAAISIINTLVQSVISAAPQLLMAGMNLILNLAQGIVANIDQITSTAVGIVSSLVGTIINYLPQILTTGFQIIMTLIQGLMQMLPQIVPAGVQLIVSLIQGLVSMLPMVISMALTVIQTLLQGLVQNMPTILQGGVQIITALIQGLVQALPQIITMGIQIIFMLVQSIVEMLPSILQAGWDIVKSLAQGIIEAVPNVLKGAWDGIKNGFSNLWDTITGKSKETSTTVSTDMSTATASMQTSVDTFSANASSAFDGLGSNVLDATSTLSNGTITDFSNMANQSGGYADALQNNVTSATNSLSSLSSADISGLQSNADSSFSAINSAGTSQVESLEKSVTSSSANTASQAQKNYDQMAKNINSSMEKINSNTSKSFDKITQTATSSMNKMKSVMTSGFTAITNAARSGASAMASAISSGMSRAVSIAQSGASRIVSVMNSLRSSMYSSGVYAMSGLSAGISAGGGGAIAAANRIANQVASTINGALKIHSPSRVTEESGEYTTEGLEVGMLNRIRNIVKAARAVTGAITDNLSTNFGYDLGFNGVGGGNFSRSVNRVGSYQVPVDQTPLNITVVSEIDGEVLAKTATGPIDKERARREQMARKVRG